MVQLARPQPTRSPFGSLRWGLQFGRGRADFTSMGKRRWGLTILLLICLLMGSSCLPTRGTTIYLDRGAGTFWSGKGVLVEVSADETQCRVVVRDTYLITRKTWVPCRNVHPRQP